MNQNNEELYHFGIPGMKWGHRKSSSVMNAKSNYKQASKDLKKAKIKKLFSKSTYLGGHNNVAAAKKANSNIKSLAKKKENAAFNLVDKQAKYAYDKKLAKTNNKEKAEKASLKVHTKAFSKGKGGLVGSNSDRMSGFKNTRYYDHVASVKGKKYAQKMEKKYGHKLARGFAAGAALTAGSIICDIYMSKK